jgi:hypothetical protein
VRLRAVATTVMVVFLGLAPTQVWAQAGWYLLPSFTLGEEFDDNIFGTSSDRQSDFVTRFSPGVQGGYRSEPLTLLVHGGLTGEVFAKHSDQTNLTSGKRGGLIFEYLPSHRLTTALEVTYVETESVISLNQILTTPVVPPGPAPSTAPSAPGSTTTPSSPAGGTTPTTTPTSPTPAPTQTVTVNSLEFGRQRATVFSASPSVRYQFSPLTGGSGRYSFTRTTLEGGTTNTAHGVALGLTHQFTQLDAGRLDYTLGIFESQGGSTTTTHAITAGWTRELTPTTILSAEAGPRFSDGDIGAEVSIRLDHQLKLAETPVLASLSYARSQGLVLGESGTFNTETFSGSVSFEPLRSLLVNVSPSIVRLTGGSTSDITSYGLTAGASYQILRWLSARAAYSFSYQDQSGGNILRNVISISLEALYPYRVDQ